MNNITNHPTIQDVARAAGVSTGTVSNVLNGYKSVAEETRSRVLETIDRLGYRKNSLARGLRTNRTDTMGLLLPTIINPFYPDLARGVEEVAREKGYTVFLCSTDRDGRREVDLCRALLEKRVDGIVVVSPVTDLDLLLRPQASAIMVMVEGGKAPNLVNFCDMVTLDVHAGITAAGKHLRALGHRAVGMVRGPLGLRRADERWRVWQDVAGACGLQFAANAVEIGDFSFESGYTAGQRLLCNPDRPTAIIAANDLMALGVIKSAVQLGLSIPADLSVVGFDNIAASAYTTPALTTVAVPKYEQGAAAVRLLLDRLAAAQPMPPQELTLRTYLEVRNSTGPNRAQ